MNGYANASGKRRAGLISLLRETNLIDVDHDVVRTSGLLRARLLDAGFQPPEMDLLIAATALVHDLTLVTHNLRDFANILDVHIIDWLVP